MKKAKKPDGCIKQLEWQSFWGQHFGVAQRAPVMEA